MRSLLSSNLTKLTIVIDSVVLFLCSYGSIVRNPCHRFNIGAQINGCEAKLSGSHTSFYLTVSLFLSLWLIWKFLAYDFCRFDVKALLVAGKFWKIWLGGGALLVVGFLFFCLDLMFMFFDSVVVIRGFLFVFSVFVCQENLWVWRLRFALLEIWVWGLVEIWV